MPISISEDGIGFVIRRVNDDGLPVGELKITGADVLTLAQSSERLRDRILGSLSRPGATADMWTPVTGYDIKLTVHGDEILLKLGTNGPEHRFLLTKEGARRVGTGLQEASEESRSVGPSQ